MCYNVMRIINISNTIYNCYKTYLSSVSKQATLNKFSKQFLDSSIAHRCALSFGILVGYTVRTVIDIS